MGAAEAAAVVIGDGGGARILRPRTSIPRRARGRLVRLPARARTRFPQELERALSQHARRRRRRLPSRHRPDRAQRRLGHSHGRSDDEAAAAAANVIDYAHSTLKTPKADILIALGCRFFFGTNSGFATVPAIYGVRCAFSNWLPIGLPLWPSQDLVAPKLFWKEDEGRYLTLQEIFESGLAFIQNWSDLPKGIALRDNSPEAIRALAEEALAGPTAAPNPEVDGARADYRRIAEAHHSYVGSTLSASFILGHRAVFLPSSPEADSPER